MSDCKIERCHVVSNNHYRMFMKYGDPLARKNRHFGEGTPHVDGYWMFEIDKRPVLRHILVAEKALGKRLPKGAIVHHIDEDRTNDLPSNLVICPDSAYHQLLHRRKRAIVACGHADWRKCQICKKYSPENELKIYSSGVKWHSACWAEKFGKRGKKDDIYIQASN